MANQNLVRQEITFACLETLENNIVVIPCMYRVLDQEFGKKGQKIGDTIYVRKPPRAIATDGAAYQPQPMIDTEVPITINQQSGVHFEYSTAEKFENIDDMKRRYLDEYSEALANLLDFRAATMIAQNAAQLVGTVGTNPGLGGTDAFLIYATAVQRLREMGFKTAIQPHIIIPEAFVTALGDFAKANFNPQPDISKLWRKRMVSNWMGAEWYTDENVYRQTIGTLGGTPAVSGANQTGSTINLSGWSNSIANVLTFGDVITFSGAVGTGCYAVNPQSRQSTGTLQDFVVQAAASSDGTGLTTGLTILPAIVPSGPFQNVDRSPGNGALVQVYHTAAAGQGAIAGLVTPQALCFVTQAAAFVCFPGDVPENVDMGYQSPLGESGVSARYTRFWWGLDDNWKNRIDVYYGMGMLYQEGAVRIAG